MRFPGLVEIRIESNQIVIFETSVETLPDHLCKIGWSSHGNNKVTISIHKQKIPRLIAQKWLFLKLDFSHVRANLSKIKI